jgi:hypothetical protein
MAEKKAKKAKTPFLTLRDEVDALKKPQKKK